MDHRRSRGQGLLRIRHYRQRLVFHANEIERVLRRIAILGGHGCHSLADIADLVDREDVVLGNPQRFIAAADRQGPDLILNLRACDDGNDTGMPAGRVCLEAADPRVRVGTSQNRDVERIRKMDVVHVLAEAANQSRIFPPLDPGADQFTDRHESFSLLEADY